MWNLSMMSANQIVKTTWDSCATTARIMKTKHCKKMEKKVTGACEMHNAFLTKTRKVRYFETKVHNVAQAGPYNMNGYRSNIYVDNIRAQSATQHYPLINQTLKE